MMATTEISRKTWAEFLTSYGRANSKRPTRLGLFHKTAGVVNDYWIEDGLPLVGLDVEFGDDLPVVQIMLDGFTHVVRDVRSIRPIFSADGSEDGLDLVREGGSTTILRFEN